MPDGLSHVTAIAVSGFYSLALKSDGTAVGWDFYEQTNVVNGLTNVVAIATSASHSLALKSDGTVIAWGDNGYGQTTVPSKLHTVTAIAAGDSHSLAIGINPPPFLPKATIPTTTGRVVAWGENSFRQISVR